MGPSSSHSSPSSLQAVAWTFAALMALTGLAGCMHEAPGDDADNGDGANGSPQEPHWINPYGFELHFDGERAYDLLLSQIYEDPEAHDGPRYRIPGTETHQQVAQELHAELVAPMEQIGGEVRYHNFTGEDYYGLDLSPIDPYLCDDGSGPRERVEGLTFSNIVARTNETHHGLLIGAHWDTKRHADSDPDPAHQDEPILGADDGASGTAAVVELARAFAQSPVELPLTFILFDGEDGFHEDDCHPLAGSLHYAQSLSDEEKETIPGMILLDMVGNQSATFYREGHSTHGFPFGRGETRSAWLVDHVWQTAASMNVTAFSNSSTGAILDDHIPFLHQDVHAIDIIRYENRFPPYWHTTHDDHTAVQPEGLEQVGVVVEAALRRYAEDPSMIEGAPSG